MPDRRRFFRELGALLLPDPHRPPVLAAGPFPPLVTEVEPRLLAAGVGRVVAALERLGAPLDAWNRRALETARSAPAGEEIQRVLDRFCLADVHINAEMRVKVARGPVGPVLERRRWRPFLLKVRNEAGTTASLRATATAGPLGSGWLDLAMFDDPPLTRTLSGLELEYRILRLCTGEVGPREASLAFDVGQGTQDLGFRNEVPILFECRPARRG